MSIVLDPETFTAGTDSTADNFRGVVIDGWFEPFSYGSNFAQFGIQMCATLVIRPADSELDLQINRLPCGYPTAFVSCSHSDEDKLTDLPWPDDFDWVKTGVSEKKVCYSGGFAKLYEEDPELKMLRGEYVCKATAAEAGFSKYSKYVFLFTEAIKAGMDANQLKSSGSILRVWRGVDGEWNKTEMPKTGEFKTKPPLVVTKFYGMVPTDQLPTVDSGAGAGTGGKASGTPSSDPGEVATFIDSVVLQAISDGGGSVPTSQIPKKLLASSRTYGDTGVDPSAAIQAWTSNPISTSGSWKKDGANLVV